ncbi:alpha/beta hydrolase-fold protein [Nocardioides marinquilinus]|uniref:Alpha/beta hydrolase-fold protein n=1 Tax=Nocardioides marinquilinus TaxID=1210400 RepID=A0ABP9Q1B8_9ACTN
MDAELPFRALPTGVDGVRHAHGPDSSPRPGVPPGTVTDLGWSDSAAYPGTQRRVRVHAPAGLDPSVPASVVVVLDGGYCLDPGEEVRGGVVLDNLVHAGDLPPTLGVFVDPADGPAPRQRNVEYDAADDRLATYLADEVLAEVGRRWALADDPARRVVGGFSSGGNAALTAAWHRPDVLGGALCSLASFAQMPGGNPYPALLAAEPRRPLRVFLHAAHRDLGWDEPEDNWLVENLRVAAALVASGYETRLVLGDGGHDPNHLGVLFPDALRWLLGAETRR